MHHCIMSFDFVRIREGLLGYVAKCLLQSTNRKMHVSKMHIIKWLLPCECYEVFVAFVTKYVLYVIKCVLQSFHWKLYVVRYMFLKWRFTLQYACYKVHVAFCALQSEYLLKGWKLKISGKEAVGEVVPSSSSVKIFSCVKFCTFKFWFQSKSY